MSVQDSVFRKSPDRHINIRGPSLLLAKLADVLKIAYLNTSQRGPLGNTEGKKKRGEGPCSLGVPD